MKCPCTHGHGRHRRDTGACQECRCGECLCDRCDPEDERENSQYRGRPAKVVGIRGTCEVVGCTAPSVGLCNGYRTCDEHYDACDELEESDFEEERENPHGAAHGPGCRCSSCGCLCCETRCGCSDCPECGEDCDAPSDGDRENPIPASAFDTDVAFSVEEAEEILGTLASMTDAGLIAEGARHQRIALHNAYIDLQQWDQTNLQGPPRTFRGKEIYPAVWGYGWDHLRRALDELEGILFDHRADFRPGNRLPRLDDVSKADAKKLSDRYNLMLAMSRIAGLWRHKLGMASLRTVVKYGRGG